MSGKPRSPYQELLGTAYDALASAVRIAHEAPLSADGAMEVAHGRHFLTPLLVRIMQLPAAGKNVPVVLHVTNETRNGQQGSATMSWRRQIGATVLDTRQFARDERLVEQSGPGCVEFALRTGDDGSLRYEAVACRFLRVRLPRWLSPHVRAQVCPTTTGWRVEVVVEWRGQLICRYGGPMRPVSPNA
jgi:hypothetical protein